MLTLILIAIVLVAIPMMVGIWMTCDIFAEALSRKLFGADTPSHDA